MTTQFVLVRHATCAQMDEVLFGRTVDVALDEHGERQAAALAHRLGVRSGLMIHASPRRRTQQTAAAIAARLNAPVETIEAIDEVDFGRWSGRSFKELEDDRDWQAWNQQRSRSRTPSGATVTSVQERSMAHLRRMAALHPSRAIALITHSEIIRSLLMYCLDIPTDNYRRIEISPASMTTLSLAEDGAAWDVKIEAVNERVSL